MRCWLVVACALTAWPAYGQEMSPLAPTPLVASPVASQSPAGELGEDSLGSILGRLDRLELENAELRARLGSTSAADFLESEVSPVATPAVCYDADGEVETWACHQPGCIHCQRAKKSGGDYPTLSWGGFLQFDTGWVSQDAENVAAVGDVHAQTGLRRVRLRAKGRVRADVSYVVDLDFAASGHPSFRDVKFTLHDRPVLQNVAVGYFQQPFGLDAMSSGRDLVLMERQLPFAFAPFRQPGVGSHGTALDRMVTWSHSGFAYPTNEYGVSEGDNGGWAYAGRVTALAYDDPAARALLHLGGSYCFEDPGNDEVSYAIEPGFFVTDPTGSASGEVPVFVDTGPIPTQNVNLTGVELVAIWGPLSLQSEAVSSAVNPEMGPQLNFGGASAKLGYVLTGESHNYHRRRGVVGGVTPAVDVTSFFDLTGGAWEATAGWAWIDLNDQSVQGGEMQTAIVGLNRYMNSFTKLQLNVIRALLDDPTTGQSAATVVALRAQAEF